MQSDYTHISFVLDRSGSMRPLRDDTIGGFNQFLEDQKAVPGQGTITLVQFDNEYTPILRMAPLDEAKPLDQNTYVPRATTALLDAIGRCILETGADLATLPEEARPAKVIFVIITDGLENASQEFTRDRINEMISEQRDKYSWQFVFLGANQDAIATAAGMGIDAQGAMSVSATSVGTKSMYTSLALAATSYRVGVREAMAFGDDDRQAQTAAGVSSSPITARRSL